MTTSFLVPKNRAESTLNGAIDNIVTSVVVASSSVFPTTYNFHLTIDNEIVTVTNNNTVTNTLTVVRGAEGTSAASHGDGAKIELRITAKAISDLNAAVNAIENDYGVASGLATLNASSLVVQNPANATATPAASKIPIADAGGKLVLGWLQEVLGITDLSDVVITSPATAQVIRYNGTAWVNAQLAHSDLGGIGANDHHNQVHTLGGSDHSDIVITTPATAQVIRYNGTQWVNTQLSHADLGGVSADQHHAQVHNLSGADHSAPISDLSMNSKKIINLANPTLAQDAATKNYVDTAGGGLGYTIFAKVGYDWTSPADATTYFFGQAYDAKPPTQDGQYARLYIPKAGTIKVAYVYITTTGTLGTGETSTMSIRLNNTTDTTISSSITTNSLHNIFSNTSLSIAVVAGDYIGIKWVTPTWVTNPTYLQVSVMIYVE